MSWSIHGKSSTEAHTVQLIVDNFVGIGSYFITYSYWLNTMEGTLLLWPHFSFDGTQGHLFYQNLELVDDTCESIPTAAIEKEKHLDGA